MNSLLAALPGLFLALASLGDSQAAPAGPGGRKLVVYFPNPDTDLEAFRPRIEDAARRLFDATEGQVFLERVLLTTCRAFGESADVWVVEGLPTRGVTLQRVFVRADTAGPAEDVFAFVLVHELGHYYFHLADEYRGCFTLLEGFLPRSVLEGLGLCSPASQPAQLDSYFCTTKEAESACLMGAAVDNAPSLLRTEFCTPAGMGKPTDHSGCYVPPDATFQHKTNQELDHGESCWETIGRSGLTMPAMPASSIAGFEAPSITTLAHSSTEEPVILVLLDASNGVSANAFNMGMLGTSAFVGGFPIGARLGIVSFDSTAMLEVPVGPVDLAFKQRWSQKSGELILRHQTNPEPPALGSALQFAQGILDGFDACEEVVLVLSGGASTQGPDPLDSSTIEPLLRDFTRVFAIETEPAALIPTLAELARETCGTFQDLRYDPQDPLFLVQGIKQMRTLLNQVLLHSLGAGLIVAPEPERLDPGQRFLKPFRLPDGTDSLTVDLSFQQFFFGTPAPELLLHSPTGVTYDVNSARQEFTEYGDSDQTGFRIHQPPAGEWTTEVTLAGNGVQLDISLFAWSIHPGLDVQTASLTSDVAFPSPVRVETTVSTPAPITGASIVGHVFAPDGAQLPADVALFDDGLQSHGDELAADGIFSGLFYGYARNGTHRIDLEVESGGESFVVDGMVSTDPAPLFEAAATQNFTVTGMPSSPATGVLTLVDPGPRTALVDASSPFAVPVLDVVLASSSEANVTLESIRARAHGTTNGTALGTMLLMHDSNEDGRIDPEDRLLATASFSRSGTELLFTGQRGEPVHAIPPNGAHRLFVVAVSATGIESEGGTAFGTFVPVGPGLAGVFAGLLALTMLVARGSRQADRTRLAFTSVLLILAGALGWSLVPACGSGGGSGGNPLEPGVEGDLSLELGPADIQARNASSGESAPIQGTEVGVTTTFE